MSKYIITEPFYVEVDTTTCQLTITANFDPIGRESSTGKTSVLVNTPRAKFIPIGDSDIMLQLNLVRVKAPKKSKENSDATPDAGGPAINE